MSIRAYTNEWKRYSPISIISVRLNDFTYLFDLHSITQEDNDNERRFMELLRKYLQNPNIKKLVHDCRYLSDMLFHQYEITFSNIYDFEVKTKPSISYRLY
jgi:hypothetical protein